MPSISMYRASFYGQKVIGSMATCRRRMDVLHKALDALAPQTDRIYVYLNDVKQSEVSETPFLFCELITSFTINSH